MITDTLNTVELNTPAELRELRESQLIASFMQEEADLDQCESEHWYSEHAREFGLIGLED
jgi:hypothetical protein